MTIIEPILAGVALYIGARLLCRPNHPTAPPEPHVCSFDSAAGVEHWPDDRWTGLKCSRPDCKRWKVYESL